MELDFSPFFNKYQEIVASVEQVFAHISREHAECMACKIECCDCCYALFDLTLIEAMYINQRFLAKFQGQEREQLIEKANQADRMIYKIKKIAYQQMASGRPETTILHQVAEARVRCPLLNQQNTCDMYDDRPITCRLYGVPTAIGGEGYTCGISLFEKGKQYPTVNLDIIHQKLFAVGRQFVQHIHSRHQKMADILVPLSMALLTDYDKAYLGIDQPETEEQP